MYRLITVSVLTAIGLLSKWQLSRRSSKPVIPPDKAGEEAAMPVGEEAAMPVSEEEDAIPVTDPNWQWPAYDKFVGSGGEVVLKKRIAGERDEEAEKGPFRVIYRYKQNQPWPDQIKVVLYSRPLLEIVAQCLPNSEHLTFLVEPKILGRELYIALDALKKRCSSGGEHHGMLNGNGRANGVSLGTHELTNGDEGAGKKAEEGEVHLKHLVRFLEKEYRNVMVAVGQCKRKEWQVTWDMLWAFLPSGKKVVYGCDHSQECLYAVVSTNYFRFRDESRAFILELDIWEFDGRSYRKCQISREIPEYKGERPFAAVIPIEVVGTPEATLEERFLKNGKKYYDLTIRRKHRFMQYTGPLFEQRRNGFGCFDLHKENADGKVMIDLESFARINPDYPMRNAKPPSASIRVLLGYEKRGPSTLASSSRSAFRWGERHSARRESGEPSYVSSEDENLKFAPAIVYGFSFALKRWGCFAVNGFRDISFDSSAFDELVMEPQTKLLVRDLVNYYTATPAADGSESEPALQRVDPISNKGNGCVFLCYGPPGTGKTLTAESIAENLSRPLWALSVSELGTTPKDLEAILIKVFDIAAAWRAVLLLDEADVYLERRTSDAGETRNAMTGIFLRLLEYYRGVLFLTTNRIDTFDEAFLSRISMFLPYPPLSTQHKEQIWKSLLQKARIRDVSSEQLSEFSALDYNGREIRNVIHVTQSWAHSKGKPLQLQDVQDILNIVGTCLKPQLTRAVQ